VGRRVKFSGIAFRLGAAMMIAAFSSVALLFISVYVVAETRVRTPPNEIKRTQNFFDRVANVCVTNPTVLPDCPDFVLEGAGLTKPGISSTRPPPKGQKTFNVFDPRPWVVPTLIGSTGFATLFALGLALLLARRIAKPIQEVSSAAKSVAGGQLSARVPVPNRIVQGDETTQLALSFNSMAQTLEENELERRQLIADIAHELRTPLAVMQSRLEALEDGVFDLNVSEVMKLQTQTKFLARLVEDLRVLSLAETGRLSLERRDLDLQHLVLEISSGFQAKAAQVGKRINVQTEAATIRADPDRVRQVLTNLLENALKYASSEVTLNLSANATQAKVTVSDDGDGLPTSDLERVFDRFYRADESRNRSSGGSGLGLSIVKAIVELHGGAVSARNLEPRGAQFTVALALL
jgi:two-component system, OmpR family, sensor histidine kinase BaeS